MAVHNKGLDSHEFTLEAEWPTGSYETKASTTGILDEACKQLIDVPLGPGAFTACCAVAAGVSDHASGIVSFIFLAPQKCYPGSGNFRCNCLTSHQVFGAHVIGVTCFCGLFALLGWKQIISLAVRKRMVPATRPE